MKIYNLGCKLNQYEGYCLAGKFSADPDVVIINTCCVTAEAERKSVKKFRSALRRYPGAVIIATGCDCHLHANRYRLAHQVIGTTQRNGLIAGVYPDPPMSRYFLKIQDGCNGPCTYCIVPVIRDRILSTTIERIFSEIAWAQAHAFREIVLVGANIGLYGVERGGSLVELLKDLKNISDLPRLRLSSIEPRFIDDDLIAAMQHLPVCRHFHVPIQSGDDEVLARMDRSDTAGDLRLRISRLARAFPDAAIGCDVIVGFPGEDDQHFSRTKALIDDLPITHAHIFPYSPRPGTAAYDLGDPVSTAQKKIRLWALKRLVAEKNLRFRRKLVGREVEVVVTRTAPVCLGLSDNYVQLELDQPLTPGTLAPVRVVRVEDDRTYGAVLAANRAE